MCQRRGVTPASAAASRVADDSRVRETKQHARVKSKAPKLTLRGFVLSRTIAYVAARSEWADQLLLYMSIS